MSMYFFFSLFFFFLGLFREHMWDAAVIVMAPRQIKEDAAVFDEMSPKKCRRTASEWRVSACSHRSINVRGD